MLWKKMEVALLYKNPRPPYKLFVYIYFASVDFVKFGTEVRMDTTCDQYQLINFSLCICTVKVFHNIQKNNHAASTYILE